MTRRLALDSNVLVYAHVAALSDHSVVREYLDRQLHDGGVVLALTASVLHEFVHVVTDPRRFEPPVGMGEALALARSWLGRSNVEWLVVTEDAMRMALDLLQRHRLGRKRVADTLLAATCLANGIREIVTCNGDDFRAIAGIQVVDPRRGS